MQPVIIKNGNREAVVSLWVSGGDSVRYVMKGRNGGSPKVLKTLEGAIKAAEAYVGIKKPA